MVGHDLWNGPRQRAARSPSAPRNPADQVRFDEFHLYDEFD